MDTEQKTMGCEADIASAYRRRTEADDIAATSK